MATDVLLLDHVPPVVGDNVIVAPSHTLPEPGTETVGFELTFTKTEAHVVVLQVPSYLT